MESTLAYANTALRNQDFDNAILFYEKLIKEADDTFAENVRFNLNLAYRRASKTTHQSVAVIDDLIDTKAEFLSKHLEGSKDEQFLDTLFNVALGRPPKEHERKHFLGGLQSSAVTRTQIFEAVWESDECKRRIADQSLGFTKKRHIYSAPSLGEIYPRDINLPFHQNPRVTVLIPVYGKVEYTLACLKSISENLPIASFEVIVLDDLSPDGSVNLLKHVENLRVVINPENLGFLRSCNNGAAYAKGEYLYLLNNDTVVTPGWLDELLETFSLFPECGLAGSKLVYPDGLLQEAGGIIWGDGSAWNYGNRQDPELPVFNYAREVDYISGASIMVPKDLFDTLGGFDLKYVPAYCEDSDLALKIRDRGLRVIYQPLSVIVHFEGVSSGTDTTQGVKAYQVSNSKKLFETWQEFLRSHRPNGLMPDAEKDRRMRYRVLVLEHCNPTPDQDAGSVSVFNIMLLMREMDFQITFVAEDNYLYDPKYTTMMQRAGIEVLYGPYTNRVEKHLEEMGTRYDLIFLFRPKVVERNVDAIKRYAPQAKTLFYTHDIHHIRMERQAQLLQSSVKQDEAGKMKEKEFAAIREVDSTIVVSTTELETLQPQLPDQHLELLPLLLNIPGTTAGFEQRKGIVFIGGYQHSPNVDAVQYFVAEVMPLVRNYLPGVKFHIVGSKPPQSVLDLASEDVVVEGFIEDLTPFLDSMRVAVAPLRYGAGVKGKVGTALAAGLPLVATPIAAEGMEILDGDQALIANSPESFANLVAELYHDADLWCRLSRRGIDFADKKFGPAASYRALANIIGRLGFALPAESKYPLSLYNPSIN